MNKVETGGRAVTAAEFANIILGIWLVVSPFVLAFSHNTAGKWNNIAVGIALIVVTLAAEWEDEALHGLVVPLAVWLFASPFVLGVYAASFLANNVSMAFIVVAAGAIHEGLRVPHADAPPPA